MLIKRLPKILLHRVPFLHKKAANPIYSQALGILSLFMVVGAIWFMAVTLRFSGMFHENILGSTQNGVYPPILGEAFVQFDFGVKPSRAFRGSVVDGMTLSETVQQASIAGNFDIAWQPFVTIDGLSDGMEGKRWVFYKNNDRISEKPDTVPVKPQDEIFARFE